MGAQKKKETKGKGFKNPELVDFTAVKKKGVYFSREYLASFSYSAFSELPRLGSCEEKRKVKCHEREGRDKK